MTPYMESCNSSCIEEFGYDRERGALYITFHSGGTYLYEGVEEDTYLGLRDASSKGKYFHNYIKDKYSCDKC